MPVVPVVIPHVRHRADRGPHLVVVGASVRGLAASAQSAGWTVHAVDLFADLDLQAIAASAIRVGGHGPEGYPAGLVAAAATCPDGPWCYTGALENHPAIIDALAARRPLAGNAGSAVRAVRDHDRLAAVIRRARLAYPDTRHAARGLPTDGSWLVKPRRSAGGRGIRPWHGGPPPPDAVWQARVAGRPWSLAIRCVAGRGRLWAVSRQLVGRPWCHAGPFAYCGSIGMDPATLPTEMLQQARRLAEVLAADFGLVGLVGADIIVDGAGRLHVIEINPRPTASMELGERLLGRSVADAHLTACGMASPRTGGGATAERGSRRRCSTIWGKAVLFTPTRLRWHARQAAWLAALDARWRVGADGRPALADIPPTGTILPAGGPFVTVFARGATEAATRAALRRRAALLLGRLSAGHAARG